MTDPQPAETPSPAQPTFEEALLRLDSIVQELEDGQIGLAEGLTRYEEGVRLLRQCYQLLDNAQRRIELLNRVDSAGIEICEPFEEAAQTLEEKAQKRSRRRSRPAEPDPDVSEDEIDGPGRLF